MGYENQVQTNIADNEQAAKERKIKTVTDYLRDEGISVDDLKAMQTDQQEVTAEPTVRPSELDGVSNVVSKSNEQLTSELASLTSRFNNFLASNGFEA